MTRIRTGPGRVESRANELFWLARLYNFDTDWHELKDEHKAWLDRAKDERLGRAAGVYVLGMASRSGEEAHNRDLSRRRKESVLSYLWEGIESSVPVHDSWAGEEHAHGPQEDDAYDRAALIAIWNHPEPTRPPAPSPPPRPTPLRTPEPPAPRPTAPRQTRQFRIRMLQALGGGPITRARFEIEDRAGRQRAAYDFSGLGPPLPGFAASWSGTGPWNDFESALPLTAADFGGMAEMDSISSPQGRGPNWTLLVLQPRRTSPIRIRDFQTGHSEAVGFSVTAGDFVRRPL